MKKSLMSLLLVSSLLAPSALVLAEGPDNNGDANSDLGNLVYNTTEDEVGAAKQEALATLETLDGLSEERKVAYRGSIGRRNTVAEIQEWLGYAQAESDKNNATVEPKITTETTIDTEIIEVEVVYEEDPELLAGETDTVEGTPGVRTITTTITYTDGVETDRDVSSVITTPVVNTIIYTGTKAALIDGGVIIPTPAEQGETSTESIGINVVKNDYKNKLNAIAEVRYESIDLDNGNVGITVFNVEDANTVTPVLYIEYNTDTQRTREVEADYILEHRLATLSEVKEVATADLSDLDLLAEEEVEAFASRIKEAVTREEVQLILAEAIVANNSSQQPIDVYSREDLLGRDDNLITFDTEDGAQAAIDALDEDDREGLEVKETEDGLFYVAHVIPAMPLTPAVNTQTVIGAVKNDFPDYDKEDYTYETEVKEDVVLVTITDAEGEFVAVVEYDRGTQLTRIISVPTQPIIPADPNNPVVPADDFYVNVVKNDFPEYNTDDYIFEYDEDAFEDKVEIDVYELDEDGEKVFVTTITYYLDTQKTERTAVPMTPLEPATPVEETTEEETTEEDEETTVEDDESGVVVDEEESEVVAGQPIQVKRTDSVDSRANLPETGELGSGLTVMAALLAGLGGLGLLFKRRS